MSTDRNQSRSDTRAEPPRTSRSLWTIWGTVGLSWIILSILLLLFYKPFVGPKALWRGGRNPPMRIGVMPNGERPEEPYRLALDANADPVELAKRAEAVAAAYNHLDGEAYLLWKSVAQSHWRTPEGKRFWMLRVPDSPELDSPKPGSPKFPLPPYLTPAPTLTTPE